MHNVTVLLVDVEGPSHAQGGVRLAEPGGEARAYVMRVGRVDDVVT